MSSMKKRLFLLLTLLFSLSFMFTAKAAVYPENPPVIGVDNPTTNFREVYETNYFGAKRYGDEGTILAFNSNWGFRALSRTTYDVTDFSAKLDLTCIDKKTTAMFIFGPQASYPTAGASLIIQILKHTSIDTKYIMVVSNSAHNTSMSEFVLPEQGSWEDPAWTGYHLSLEDHIVEFSIKETGDNVLVTINGREFNVASSKFYQGFTTIPKTASYLMFGSINGGGTTQTVVAHYLNDAARKVYYQENGVYYSFKNNLEALETALTKDLTIEANAVAAHRIFLSLNLESLMTHDKNFYNDRYQAAKTTINAAIEALKKVNVKIVTNLDGVQQDAATAEGVIGGTYTPDLPAVEGTFMFWTVNGAVRTDLPQNHTFKVTSKLELVAHFASTGKYSVAYLDTNTKLIDVEYVDDTVVELTPPVSGSNPKDVPGREGATFDGWALITNYEAPASTSLENPGDRAYFITKYTVTEAATYTVTVSGGTADKENYKLNEVATVTATNPTEFSYWIDVTSGAILSTNSTYSFTILDRNESIEAIYDTSFVSGPMVSIRRFFEYKAGYDTFIGHYELGEGDEFIEAGFVHDDHVGRHISKNFNQATNEFMMSADELVLLDNDYKMRAYLTYRVIATNEIKTVYNLSRYELKLEATAPGSTPDTIYAVGTFNNWSVDDGYITLNKEVDKYVATQTLVVVEKPGIQAIKFKFLSGLGNWNFVEENIEEPKDAEGNRLAELRNVGVLGNNCVINKFKYLPDPPIPAGHVRFYVKDTANWHQYSPYRVYIFWDGGKHTEWKDSPTVETLSVNGYRYVDIEVDLSTKTNVQFIIMRRNASNTADEGKTNNIPYVVGKTYVDVIGPPYEPNWTFTLDYAPTE